MPFWTNTLLVTVAVFLFWCYTLQYLRLKTEKCCVVLEHIACLGVFE